MNSFWQEHGLDERKVPLCCPLRVVTLTKGLRGPILNFHCSEIFQETYGGGGEIFAAVNKDNIQCFYSFQNLVKFMSRDSLPF